MCLTDGVLQAYTDEELTAAERAEAAVHLATCENCRQRAALVGQRRSRVAALLAVTAPAEGLIAEAALARFHAHAADAVQASALRPGPLRKMALAAGLLAVATLATVVVLNVRLGPAGPADGARLPGARPSTSVPPGRHDTPVAATPQATEAAAPPVAPVGTPRPSRVRRSALLAAPAEPYLLLTDDVGRPEMGLVMRVRLPLSALATFAEMPPTARTSPEIEADVLVGQDGRARAIRFVSQTLTPGRK